MRADADPSNAAASSAGAPGGLPPLVDTHCHLAWESFQGDLPAVLDRARAAGVEQMVVVATDPDTAEACAAVCERAPGCRPTAGMHPNDLPTPWRPAWERTEAQLRSGRFVGVGETGLDYFRDTTSPADQRACFLEHARLARTLDLPLIVHIRDRDGRFAAYDDVAEVLAEVEGVRGVIHCYTGDAAHAERYLALGMHVSFSGILTFPKGENVREAARAVPIERALVETDAPFLAPVPHRGERNEPAFVADTARRLAEIKGLSEADVRRITTAGARRLFRLPGEGSVGPAVYAIRDAVYVNVTNACDARCVFCPRTHDEWEVKGHDLARSRDPSFEEVVAALGDPGRWKEVVFCGLGEPTLRLDLVKAVARWVKARGGRTRLNTNGHADAIHRRPVAPELAGLIDVVSVSLNAQDRATFERHCPSAFSPDGFTPMIDFVRSAKAAGLSVVCTAVGGLEGVDVEACRRLAEDDLGVAFRGRELDEIG
jgi:TatD DNase family protein